MEDQPAAGRGGVQSLMQALEPDTPPAQRAHDGDQIGQLPGQPVHARHHQGVAGPQVVQAGRQLRPAGILARQLVDEHAQAARRGQGVPLAVQQLAGSADPGVADQRKDAERRADDRRLGDRGGATTTQLRLEQGLRALDALTKTPLELGVMRARFDMLGDGGADDLHDGHVVYSRHGFEGLGLLS